MKNKIFNKQLLSKSIFLIFINLSLIYLLISKGKFIIKVGIVGVRHETNIGNNLIKYAMTTKLKELGYFPYIIGTVWKRFNNIEFINQTTNLVIIKNNFSEIKQKDYDILMVNSDQTWVKYDEFFYDYGFLQFAEFWNITKIVYGASIGSDTWQFSEKDETIMKRLLKNFSGISVREKGSIELIKKHLDIVPELVLDPTFLIDKKYYLDLIKDLKDKIQITKKYIFVYNIANDQYIINSMKNASEELNLEINYFPLNNDSSVSKFIYYLINSKAVITNSYHGTVFSIIFNKPFLTIYNRFNSKERYISLGNSFNVKERIFERNQKPNYQLLKKPLDINYTSLKKLKIKSINFLKKHLMKAH